MSSRNKNKTDGGAIKRQKEHKRTTSAPHPNETGGDSVGIEMDQTYTYLDVHAHLIEELRWLNRLLAAHVLRLRRVDFYDRVKNFREFFIAEEEIDALMAAGIFEADGLRSDDKRSNKSGGASGAGRGTARRDQPADERNTGSSFTCHAAVVL